MKTSLVPVISRSPFLQQAFTLVEVTLAIGVVSFAVLGLLGLVPMGLIAVRESSQQVAYSHILRKVGSDLTTIDRAGVAAYLQEQRYFDPDGRAVAENDANRVYVTSFSSGALRFPGSEKLEGVEDHTRIVVTIAKRPSGAGGEAAGATFRTSLALPDFKR